MRRRRRGIPRHTWWLLLILGLAVGPLLASASLAVGLGVLAGGGYVTPGGAPPDPAPPPAPPNERVRLSITVQGDGQVFVSPPGGVCYRGQTCTVEYNHGDQVVLGAVAGFSPGSNARFLGWNGDCRHLGREPYPRLVMDAPKDCVARFIPP